MEKRRRILVTGAGGMVGSYVLDAFSSDELILTDVQDGYEVLNVTDKAQVKRIVLSFHPDVILHLAAATDVDRCEREPAYADRLNRGATANLVEVCPDACTFIYISTGAIFSTDPLMPCVEVDTPNPKTYYSRSKLEGEDIVKNQCRRHLIARAGWMMGGSRKDKKFVGKMAQKILSGEKKIKVVNDRFGSPTYAKDLVLGIKRLLDGSKEGIYHLGNGWGCSRYDVALEIRQILGKNDVEIIPVSSSEFLLDANRPASEEIMNQRLMNEGENWMRGWKEALEDYLINDYFPAFHPELHHMLL